MEVVHCFNISISLNTFLFFMWRLWGKQTTFNSTVSVHMEESNL